MNLSHHLACSFSLAPHEVDTCYPGVDQFSDPPFRSWAVDADPTKWEQSLEFLADHIRTHGPYDGIYGFSQGGALATEFCHSRTWKDRFGFSHCPFSFAVLACAASSQHLTLPPPPIISPSNESEEDAFIEIPSVHVMGKDDKHLPKSKLLARYWKPSMQALYTHKGGHIIDMQMIRREQELGVIMKNFLEARKGSSTPRA